MTSDANESAATSASPAPFDPEALRIIRSSAITLARLEAEFTSRLHQDIVALSPNVALSMTGAGRPFCARMAQALIWVALSNEPPSVMADVLRQVGADNYYEGFRDPDYVSVAHALLRAIRDLSDSDWVTSMGSAWISCFMWMQPHLVTGAQQAAATHQGVTPAEEPPKPEPPAPPEPAEHISEPPQHAASPDDDDDELGYGQIMMSMTLNPRRDR